MSIPNILEKINPKRLLALYSHIPEKVRFDTLYIAILVMVASISYGMGYVFAISTKKEAVVKTVVPVASSTTSTLPQVETSLKDVNTLSYVVASSKGTKYHFPWCSGAKAISTKNKITFKSPELAEKVGYTLAANCK